MSKTIKCPYCNDRYPREILIKHIDRKHVELLPNGFTGIRMVYHIANKLPLEYHGSCRVCKKPTNWNGYKYDVLCNNLKCKEALRNLYKTNMLRVRGTYNILNDTEQQKRMLANRHISGTYKFNDGGMISYTGSYELKFLEFIDNFLNIPSKDIISPGPTIEYIYQGKKHFYLPDFFYIPFNLIVEIKDGGEHPNGKVTGVMKPIRERTIEKERVITDKGEYNYLRLSDNQFEQLIDIFMDIKDKLLRGVDERSIRINESVEEQVLKEYFTE